MAYQLIQSCQTVVDALHDAVRSVRQPMAETPLADPRRAALQIVRDALQRLLRPGQRQSAGHHLVQGGPQDAVVVATHATHPPAIGHALNFGKRLQTFSQTIRNK